MSHYLTQANLAESVEIHLRIASAAASQGIQNPLAWAKENAWVLAITPGWAEAAETEEGIDLTAITDEMILDAVTGLLSEAEAGI